MFRNNYQGGAVVEIFSGQGKDPVANWKLCGGPSAIHKEYNKEVKGFVYCLEGSSQTTKMQMPENGKLSLGLVQRFLVLQVNVPESKDFSVELVITDLEHLKRRLHLSTVHKEMSVNLLHAKIPFLGLKRNIWCTLCIDLVSFTGALFKGFLKLDVITLFATCKIRRIFTMKTGPTRMSDDDILLSGAVMDLIPRSCQFPPDVNQFTQVFDIENLQKAVSAQSASARSTSYWPQSVLHTAPDSRISGQLSQTGRKSSAASDGMHRSKSSISNTKSSSTGMKQKFTAESQSIASLSESLSHRKPTDIHVEGTPGSLQLHPPKDQMIDKPGHKKPQFYCVERDACSCSPVKERSVASPTTSESLSCLNWLDLSHDLQVCRNSENEGFEPQFTLQEEVYSFSSQPHSPKRGQGQGDQEKMVMGDQVQSKSGRRHEAQPEDDFIGSESDEDKSHVTFQHQRACAESNPATPRSPNPTLDVQIKVQPESHNINQTEPRHISPATTSSQSPFSGRAEPAEIAPTRCLSPNSAHSRYEHKCGPSGSGTVDKIVHGNSSVLLSRRLLQEVELDDFTQHKVIVSKTENDKPLKPVDSSSCDFHLLSSLRMQGGDDDEELKMLATLKREQEEDECRASGLTASQIHQCNVSISMSSDSASIWTNISMPANQGHHYQKEMNHLLQSNPREWMDVLSPPIMPPSQQRRSGNTWNNHENLIRGDVELVHEEEEEDEYLNLLYDPCLNCYFDPKTGKYYELA